MSLFGMENYGNAETALKKAIQYGRSNKTIYFSHLTLARCYLVPDTLESQKWHLPNYK